MKIKEKIFNEKKETFNELIIESLLNELCDLQKRINSNNLTYEYKTKGRSPKGFRNDENLIDSFKDLRDGNVNTRKVFKNQINFESDLYKTKKENPISRSENQMSVTQNIESCLDLSEKIIIFFRYYSILLSEVKCKVKHEKGLKMLTPKQMLQRLSVAIAQLKAGNASANSINEIRKIIYSLHYIKQKKSLEKYIKI